MGFPVRLFLLWLFLAVHATASGADSVKSGSNSAPGTPSRQASPESLANFQKSAEIVVNAAQRAIWSLDIPATRQILTDGVISLGFLAIEAQERNGSPTFAVWRDDDNTVQFAERKTLPDGIHQQTGEMFTRPLLANGKEFGRLTFHVKAATGSLKLTDAERAYLTGKGVIRMCVPPDWLPYLGIDEQGRVAGIGADLVALMQERLGVRFELHPTREWGESLTAIRERRCDILPLASDLPERRAAMNFTRPYLTSPFVVATRIDEAFIRDGSEIGARRIGIVKDYSFAALVRQHYPNIQIVDVKNTGDGLKRVSKGEIWGYLDAIDSVAYSLQKHSMHDLKINGKLEFGLDLSLASRKDEQPLSAIMQKATDSIGDEERRAIVNKWIAVRFEQGVDYAPFWKLGGAAMLLLLAAYAWNRRLARFNKDLSRAQSALRQTANELETILEHAWIGVFVTSGERKVVRMNNYAAAMVFRCQPDEYIGVSTRSMFSSDEDYETFTKKVRAAASANVSVEHTFCRRDGSPFLAKAIGSLLDPANPGKGAIWLLTDITEQRADEEKLARTLNELEIIFQNASIGINYLQGRQIARVNAAITQMFGYKAEDLIGKTTRLYYASDEDYEAMAEAHRALANGLRVYKREVMMRRADGSDLLCGLTGSLVDPDDPAKGSIWLHQDITEQRAAEEKLAQTLKEMEIIFENASIGIVYLVERHFLRVNKTFETLSGYPAAELLGQSTRTIYASEEIFESFAPHYEALAAGQQVVRTDAVLRKPDGSNVICELTGSLVDSKNPETGSIWLYRDMTEQRAAEERLTQTLNELDVIFNNANVGIVFLVNRRFVRVNRTFETIFGWPADELLGQDTRRFYASDAAYEAIGKASRELPAGEAILRLDLEMRRADGSDILCEGICSYVDPSDRTKGVVWLFSDVTEQRAAADKLTRTLSELDIIFNNASVAIAFLVDRRFVRVNRTFETMVGWSAADLIGQTARRFYKSDEAYAAIGTAIREFPADETVVRIDLEMRRADGSEILCEAVCSYVDPTDRSKGMIWLFSDVTELRRAQAALQNARDDALAKNALIEQQHRLVTRTLDQVATLLNNSGQGFLSFGRDLMIEEGYSQECQRIFGRDVLDLPLPELLFGADAGQRGFLEKTLRLILDSAADPLRRDAYLGLLPAEYQLGERHCKADYRLLDDARMMLILTDISDEKRLRERLALERLRLEFVVNALENRDDLLETLRDFETFRSRGLPDLLSFERQPRVLLDEVFRQVHTFKSLFAQASLPTIPEVLHELESRLGQLRDSMDEPGADLDTNAIKRELGATDLGAALEQDVALLREKLGEDFFNSEREIRVPASKLAGLEAEAGALYGNDSRMLGMIRYLRYVPLHTLIEPHFKAAEQLARRQDKLLAPIVCKGDVAPVDPETYGPFCKSLVHLFRNAVDHGIEDADARLLADKDETATIRCEVRTAHDHLSLTIADDGRGIDAGRIRAVALAQGKVGAGGTAPMNDADALMLIFADGVTTSEEISTISGRGVGLGAVWQELVQLGGTVRVDSVVDHGTRFEFTLPYQPPAAASNGTASYEEAKKLLAPLPEIVKTFCRTHLELALTVDATLNEFAADRLFEFTALISLGSGLNARIGLSIERPLLLEMTRRFEPDFAEDAIEELADSVGAEIANTVVGNATVYFTHLAHHVAMGTPLIVKQEQRAEEIGPRVFRGFTGRGDAGAFIIFCIPTEETPA